jgi:uncharacterized glyoxalase superfamily protein PhnB
MAGKIIGSAPVLLVADVVKAADYYRDKLGFTYDRFWGEPPDFVILNRDSFSVMLSQVNDASKVVPHWKVVDNTWNIYFWVDDVEAVYAEMQESGAIIDYTLCMKVYGVKEFGVQDLDGHDIAFGQIMEK